jgi:6-phosphogluconolactonase
MRTRPAHAPAGRGASVIVGPPAEGDEMPLPSPFTSWSFSLALLLCGTSAAFPDSPPAKDSPEAGKMWVYVGTYTDSKSKSKGIYRFELDPAAGKLTDGQVAAEIVNPSFLAVAPGRRFLYAVGEVASFQGKPGGLVSAFALDPKTGNLTALNQQSSGGAGPCHLVVDRLGKHVLAANYGGGNASVLAVGPDGRLGQSTAFVQHMGMGSNPKRQKTPHAHSINLDAANRFAFVADLGLDGIFVYRYDPEKGTLTPNQPGSVALAPGSGPRHFAFHPSGRYAYVINEMGNTVTAMKYDPQGGILTKVQTVSTLPPGFKGNSDTAEVQVHPSGKFVYGSNRGHDSIVAYRVNPDTGELTYVGNQGTDIKTPRNFGIDPSGKFLIVANQDSASLVVFRIDPETGALKPTGHKVAVPRPVCVKFVPRT